MSGNTIGRIGLQVVGGLIGSLTPFGAAGGILVGGPVGSLLMSVDDPATTEHHAMGDEEPAHVDP